MVDEYNEKQYELEEADKMRSIQPERNEDCCTQPIDSFLDTQSARSEDMCSRSITDRISLLTNASHFIYVPFILSLLALVFTGTGSWSCNYFHGATIVFTSARYGLWTLQDASGKCQLWDQLFFSFYLGVPLRTARFFSMVAQLDGLAITAVMTQALQFHIGSWAILIALFVLFLASVLSSGLFNLWTFFFLFTYVIFTLIIRYLFIHPVHRRISKRGCKIISGNCALCSLFSFFTLIVLKSEYCTCKNITSEQLEGREIGLPCEGSCTLDVAGGLMILAGILWGITSYAVLKIGVQHDVIRLNDNVLQTYAHYPRQSIITRVTTTIEGATRNFGSAFKNKEDISDFQDDNNDDADVRSRCKKACCDYRVTQRNSKEQLMFWSFRLLLGVLVTIYIFFITLKIKSFYENLDASIAPDTIHFFTLDAVCAFNPNNTNEPFKSYGTKQDAVRDGFKVAHCGECAHCSNPWDIKTYVETRQTIAKKAKKCAIHAVFGTDEELTYCLQEAIGFSPPCTKCWTENMINTATYCLYTCMKATLNGSAKANNIKGTGNATVWMNQCIYCDEKMSGPEFVTCSGVARRRLGVRSEIERNPMEQCQHTDVDWVNTNFYDLFPNLQDPNLYM